MRIVEFRKARAGVQAGEVGHERVIGKQMRGFMHELELGSEANACHHPSHRQEVTMIR